MFRSAILPLKSDTSPYYKQNESVKDLGVFAYKENVAPEVYQ